MFTFCRRLLLALLIVFAPLASPAQDHPATKEEAEAYVKQQAAKLHPQHGKIPLAGDLATLTLPEGFGYLPPDQTEILIHNIWQNPPGTKTLGTILPEHVDLLSPDSWAVIITYKEEGHIKDEDADTLDYDELLKQMQQANKDATERRREEGYRTYDLVGWATRPHYDKAAHKLYWAIALQPEGGSEQELNYNIRILGRKGYLVLSMVGTMAQLPMMEKNADKILSFVDFNTSQRYADFNPATDKVAAYGMAALIAGYAAAKVGLFKGFLVALVALKKFIILAVVAVVAFFKKLFGRKKKD